MFPRPPLILLAALPCAACATPTAPAEPSEAASSAFPAAWLGSWAGTVEVTTPTGPRPGFPMRLDIAATEDPELYDWTITYPNDDVRAYTLIVRDAAAGAYAIDENNGIVLEARWLAGRLHSWFEVNGSLLVIQESLVDPGTPDEALLFEVWSTVGDPIESGGEDTPVRSHLPGVQQRARLSRVSEPVGP